jgi:hypothetical protein
VEGSPPFASISRATARAESPVTVMDAFTAGLYFSIRFRQACVRSTGDAALLRSNSDALLNDNAVRSCISPKAGVNAHAVVAMPVVRKFRRETELSNPLYLSRLES